MVAAERTALVDDSAYKRGIRVTFIFHTRVLREGLSFRRYGRPRGPARRCNDERRDAGARARKNLMILST